MKKKIYQSLPFLFLLWILATGCNKAPKGDEATIQDSQQVAEGQGITFLVDTAASFVRFNGFGVGKNHPGRFRLQSGVVSVKDNTQVTGGDFIIDIPSLSLEQEGDMFEQKLKPHLLSGDFFDAEKFKTASFKITDIKPYENQGKDTSIVEGANFQISGNLTLKDKTKNISFPARIDLDGEQLKAKANFDIDRREWEMNYGNDKTLGDKFISEKVNIQLDLQAKGNASAN